MKKKKRGERKRRAAVEGRHDSLVPREEDGEVEFRILAQMFRSELASSQRWSIRAWLNCLQKRGGPRKRFQYCVDPFHADTILYLRAIQGHSGGKNTLILYCKTTCCYRAISPSTSTTLEAPTICTLDHSIWIDFGWQRRQERETCGVLYSRE